jgi:hypothetical protein
MRNNKLQSKFRPGYSGTIHGLFYIKDTNRSPTMNYWICSMKLLEIKLKRIKKTPYVAIKVKSITSLYSYQKNKQLILKN